MSSDVIDIAIDRVETVHILATINTVHQQLFMVFLDCNRLYLRTMHETNISATKNHI